MSEPLQARLRKAADDLTQTMNDWQSLAEIPTLAQAQQNTINLLREAATALAGEGSPPDEDDGNFTIGGEPWTDEQVEGMRAIALRADICNARTLLESNGYVVAGEGSPVSPAGQAPAESGIWCDLCGAVKPLVKDYMPADERNAHAATDLMCGECRSIIATIHYLKASSAPAAGDGWQQEVAALKERASHLEDAAFHFQTCHTCRLNGEDSCPSGKRFAAFLRGEENALVD